MTPPPPVGRITRAEARVLDELLRDGPDNRVIADRLNVTVDTVKAHLKALMAAAGTANRTALVVAVVRGTVRLRVVPMRTDRRKPIDHGTWGGFLTHHRRDEEMCEPCEAVGHEHLASLRSRTNRAKTPRRAA